MTIDDWTNDIHQGDARETLSEMPDSSVHMAMCSPPYYGLRDYDADGQIGLEETLDEYIQRLVDVGDELKRVLRPDGSWWLNLGDSYANKPTGSQPDGEWSRPSRDESQARSQRGMPTQFGRKQKMLVPHRAAIALQDAGWVVRNDAVWAKPNPMPEAVKDRLSTTFEFVFHLVPEPDYWYDLDAIREPHKSNSIKRSKREDNRHDHSRRQSVANEETLNPDDFVHPAGKNPGDVFDVTVRPFSEAHFAVYPPELCEKPIKATCPPKACAECGRPYEREVDREPGEYDYSDRAETVGNGQQASGTQLERPSAELKGWDKPCDCDTDDTESGVVLDPFAGAGTTCLVAKRLGRRFVGIDLNADYVAMAQKRVGVTVDDPERLLDAVETTLSSFTGGGQS